MISFTNIYPNSIVETSTAKPIISITATMIDFSSFVKYVIVYNLLFYSSLLQSIRVIISWSRSW